MTGVWILASIKHNEEGLCYPVVIGAWSKKQGAYQHTYNMLMDVDSIRLGDIPHMVESLFKGKNKKIEKSYLEYVPGMFLTLAHLHVEEGVEEIRQASPKKPKKVATKTKVVAVKSGKGKTTKPKSKTPSPKKSSIKLEKVDDYTIKWLAPSEDLVKKFRDAKKYSMRKVPKKDDYVIKSAFTITVKDINEWIKKL